MNSWLLPLWQNESLCQTIRTEMHVACAFILLKINPFSWEMFCSSIRSKTGLGKQQLQSGNKVCISAKWSIWLALPPVSVA